MREGETVDKKEKAYELYLKGYKLIDISNEIGVKESTLRSWKKRGDWDNATAQRNGVPKSKKKCNVAKKNVAKCNETVAENENDIEVEKLTGKDVREVMQNNELTDKQKLFCVYYMRDYNATHAYQKAYGGIYSTSMVQGSKLLSNPKVKEEINRLKAKFMEGELVDAKELNKKLVQKYMNIAFSDITDYVSFGKKKVQVGKKKGKPEYINVNYVDLKESTEVDGTLITEIKEGKDGVSIKLASKDNALKWLADHYCFLTQEQQARIDMMKSKTVQEEETETEGDGFIEALEGKVDEVWEKE